MKSFKEIMAKVAGALPPELAANAARVKQVQDPLRPGAETPPKSLLKARPKTASVSDELDGEFVGWMEAKAEEDVVKVAAPLSTKIRAALTSGKSQEAVEGLMSGEKLKSMLSGTAVGGALTAGAGALYLKGRKDQRRKTAGLGSAKEWKDTFFHKDPKVRAAQRAKNKAGHEKRFAKKTAGINQHVENTDLLELIKKRMAAGSPLVGDV